jgi:hypothetical protein
MRKIFFVVLLASSFVVADTFTERWFVPGGGLPNGPNSYVDKGPGPDRLPYTADDVTLPENGNAGGTWEFGFLDSNGDGTDEHTFSLVRRGDDGSFTLSTWSDFAHGVIAEGELWVDSHETRHAGPAGTDPKADDFEWNDDPGWEGQSNWFWYNNMRANQRGLGGSRYYFEYRDPIAWPGAFDEVQQWVWNLNLATNTDDGTGIEGDWGGAADLLVKGLFIPVAAIPDLKNGDLDSLFGWQDVDMAAYVRDTLYPKLTDPDLEIFQGGEGGNGCDTFAALPPTFVMIIQAETKIAITDLFKASYWDVTGEEDAYFRWSSISIKGDSDMNPAIKLEPDDGRLLNMWRRDDFVRDNPGWGALEVGTTQCPDFCWSFVADGTEDCQADNVLRLPASSGPDDSYVAMPIGRELDGTTGAIVARALVALEEPDADNNEVQVILTKGTTPIAWAAIKSGQKPRLGVGGDDLDLALGSIENPAAEGEGPADVDILKEGEGYTTIELLFAPKKKSLELRLDDFLIYTFEYTADVGSKVDKLWFYAQSDGDFTGTSVDDISVLQEYALTDLPLFRRGDTNHDNQTNIADVVTLLAYLFASGVVSCLDSADTNDSGKIDIADAVYELSYLFASGPLPPDPGPDNCGTDLTADEPEGGGNDLGCESYDECP